MHVPGTAPNSADVIRVLAASPLFEGLDEAVLAEVVGRLEYFYVVGGERLIEPDQPADHLFVVLSGHLRLTRTDPGDALLLLGDAGQGETIGITGLRNVDSYGFEARAARDSEVARLPNSVFVDVARRHPVLWERVASLTADLLERALSRPEPPRSVNITLLPADPGAPLRAFAQALHTALQALDETSYVNSEAFDAILGEGSAQDDIDVWDETDRRVVGWMAEQERTHHYVVYEADPDYTAWTRRCVRQADRVVIVARSTSNSALTQGETDLFARADASDLVDKELVLIEDDDVVLPKGTRDWLDRRPAVEHVHHVRLGNADDIARLARHLAGEAVGLVLGGGGARGNAHLGVIEALRELGVPIDLTCGTSAGGGVAAQVACGWDNERLKEANHHAFVVMAPFHAFTVPFHSLMRTPKVDAPARWLFGEAWIEDLWLPFFCVSCDITNAEMMVHRRGRLWKAIRATTALPGVLPPMLLRGRLLVDGGVVDNTPVQTMQTLTSGPVVLVDVSPPEDGMIGRGIVNLPENNDVIMSLLHPLLDPLRVPSAVGVLVSTMTVASKARKQRDSLADLIIRPDVSRFGMTEFEAQNEMAALGYNATMQAFADRRDDALFLARFGLRSSDIPDPVPQQEVPIWESEQRKRNKAIRQTAIQSAVLAAIGAFAGWLLPWVTIPVGAVALGGAPSVRALLRWRPR